MKEIPLTKGKRAIVDDDDYEMLSKYTWNYHELYAMRSILNPDSTARKRQIATYMHYYIIGKIDGMFCDHINRNTLDNRRCNLRMVTKAESMRNRSSKNSKCGGYKGVTFEKNSCRWRARIMCNRKSISIGTFATKEEAAMMYNEYAIKYHGEYAYQNAIGGGT